MKLQTVHLRVNDAGTGRPTPCRIRVVDGAGNYFAPFGRLAEFASGRNQDVGGNVRLGASAYAYIDGSCEIAVPPGLLQVQISKGPEFQPLREDVALAPGKLALRFTLQRLTDLREQGWRSGDTRVHFMTPHAALLEGQAEDVHVVNLLATENELTDRGGRPYPAITNILAFSGQAAALGGPDHLVAVNTHNTHADLGSLALLHSHRVVYPLSFGGPAGTDDWTFADWCDQCHRKKGLVVWTRTSHESADGFVGEPLANAITGKIDAFEITYFEDSPFDVLSLWYTLLQAGIRVPLVGASGKESNGSALGVMRTYARLLPGAAFGYGAWIDAVRAGRTFVTNGPLLLFSVDGQDPGATIHVPQAGHAVSVRAEVRGLGDWSVVEVLYNGAVVAATSERTETAGVLQVEMPAGAGGWLAARCTGPGQVPDKPAYQRVFAHTSPCYLSVGSAQTHGDPEAIDKLLIQLDHMMLWARERARCTTDKDRQRLLAVFQAARTVLERRYEPGASEPEA